MSQNFNSTELESRLPEAERVSLILARRLAALLGSAPDLLSEGDPLPRGWECILFTPAVVQSELRLDGHHYRPGGVDADASLVFGGRRIRFHDDVVIGAQVRRHCTGFETREVVGRAGASTIQTRRFLVSGDDGRELYEEEEDMIYRPTKGHGSERRDPAPAKPAPNSLKAFAEIAYAPSETMLFRYSAIGFNTHRIHYDLPYARENEGHRHLVVNGGLTTLMMVEFYKSTFRKSPKSIATKLMRPLYCGDEAVIKIAEGDGIHHAWVENAAGEMIARTDIG